MPLTPLDIHNKEFSRRLRGYDEDEVNEFLDQVIKDYESVIRENKELQNQLLSIQERLDHFVNIEESLSKTILVAQEAADDVKNNSRRNPSSLSRKRRKTPIGLLTKRYPNPVRLLLRLKNCVSKLRSIALVSGH